MEGSGEVSDPEGYQGIESVIIVLAGSDARDAAGKGDSSTERYTEKSVDKRA